MQASRIWLLCVLALSLGAGAAGCYNDKDPNLPPCPKYPVWPDPCAAASRDGGNG